MFGFNLGLVPNLILGLARDLKNDEIAPFAMNHWAVRANVKVGAERCLQCPFQSAG
jgi:hypothetical protein